MKPSDAELMQVEITCFEGIGMPYAEVTSELEWMEDGRSCSGKSFFMMTFLNFAELQFSFCC